MKLLVYTSFLLIITLRFTCAEEKIGSTTKKSQNIINIIAGIDRLDKFLSFLWKKDRYATSECENYLMAIQNLRRH